MIEELHFEKEVSEKIHGKNDNDQPLNCYQKNSLSWREFRNDDGFVYSVPEWNSIYATYYFLDTYNVLQKHDSAFGSFSLRAHGIRDAMALESFLIKTSFYEPADSSTALSLLKVSELKNLLKKHDLKVSGKKDELIERIVSNVSLDLLLSDIPTDVYRITNLAKEWMGANESTYGFYDSSRDYGTYERYLRLKDEPDLYCEDCGDLLDLETHFCKSCGKVCKNPLSEFNYANTARDRKRAFEIGSVCYRWMSSKDQRTRPSHKEMDDVIVFFMPKGKRPLLDGIRGDAGEFPDCRCDMIPISFPISDDLGEGPYKFYNYETDTIEHISKNRLIEMIRFHSKNKVEFDQYLKFLKEEEDTPIHVVAPKVEKGKNISPIGWLLKPIFGIFIFAFLIWFLFFR
ncbi:MAG: hypothetical protein IJR89_01775 [Clostridia bacterium]|nr:hypothetical protein [Clostridia bacterium]